jgi:CRISPR-associated protein Cas1
VRNLRTLPKVRDSWSYLYVDRCRIDQDAKAIAIHDARGKVPVPCASISLLMLGPGSTITHAAIRALADNGCMVCWLGEAGVRFYAMGHGETRSARRLMYQAETWADPVRRLETVYRLYRMRFGPGELRDLTTLQQLRGREGQRVRAAYAEASRATGVPWRGRHYRPDRWDYADPINRALSAANSCLYGVCHAAIVAAGYSPALGFIHTGRMLSFVYDIADLYKTEVAVPIAFRTVAESDQEVDARTRTACREYFYRQRILQRIVPDIAAVLADTAQEASQLDIASDAGQLVPAWLWDDQAGEIEGGVNYGEDGIEASPP